jgi:glyoxylase-like metal-dependent hydrolase (beta-lactamase superfamily II)
MSTGSSLSLSAVIIVGLAACGSPPPPAPLPPPTTAPATSAPVAGEAPTPAPSASASAGAPPAGADKFADVTVKVEKVAGSVYVLKGAGGNIGVSVGDDGTVLVDDEFAPLAPKIKDALRGITDKPIKVVLNTHWHGDHTGANAIFGADAPILAHENVRKRLASGGPAIKIGDKSVDAIPPAPHGALPIITFDDKVYVHLNGEDIRAIHFPSGHTDGDVIVFFMQSNVVHMGDDFVTYGFPFVDLTSGGSIRGLAAAIDKVIPQLAPDVKIIPGHGDVSTIDDMKKLSAALKDCVKIVEAEVKKQKTLEQIQQAKVLAKYDDLGKGALSADAFIETIYKELTGQQNAYIPH